MGRNCISRYVHSNPSVKGFRPICKQGRQINTIVLSLDEFEAIRLLDHQNLNQEEAAVQMNVSRPTLTRIYQKARNKFATALVEGCILLIEGGEVHFLGGQYHCPHCHHQIESQGEVVSHCPKCNSQDLNQINQDTKQHCHRGKRCYKGGNNAMS